MFVPDPDAEKSAVPWWKWLLYKLRILTPPWKKPIKFERIVAPNVRCVPKSYDCDIREIVTGCKKCKE